MTKGSNLICCLLLLENGQIGLAPGAEIVPAIDELPPPSYTTIAGGAPMVSCRVCQVRTR